LLLVAGYWFVVPHLQIGQFREEAPRTSNQQPATVRDRTVTQVALARTSRLLQSGSRQSSNLPVPAMRYDYRDFALRALFLTAGGVAALLLALKGYGTALPAIAVGGALGAFFAARVHPGGEPER
jgi:hypothetical protein